MRSLRYFLFLFIFWPTAGITEYRVFVLKISKASADPTQPEESRFLESTLDPEQYRLYHTVYPNEKVSYVDTWRCYGRTDNFKPHCPNPRAPASTDPTASPDQISAPVPPAK